MNNDRTRFIEDPEDFVMPETYIYADDSVAETPWVLSGISQDIAQMWRHRFIDESSLVFANALYPYLGLWILNSHGSAYTRVIHPRSAGWVRLSNTHCRWGRVQRNTNEGTAEINLAAIDTPGVDPEAQQNVVVSHGDARSIAIVSGGQQYRPSGGVFTSPAFRIIDLPSYDKPLMKEPNAATRADAWVNGVKLLTHKLNRPAGLKVRDNVDAFRFDGLRGSVIMNIFSAQNIDSTVDAALPQFLSNIRDTRIEPSTISGEMVS